MSRFFVPPENIGDKTIDITDRGDLHHMRKVLRLRPGDEVDVSDTDRFEYRCRIESIEDECAILTILDKQAFATEPVTRVTLYQGIPKQGKMESIIQKCVELGVSEIVPVFMERTVVVDKGNNMQKKVARWNKVSAEAVKQCRRGIIPVVRDAAKMPEIIGELADYDLVLIPYEDEDKTTIKQVLRGEGGTLASVSDPTGETDCPQKDSSIATGDDPRIAVLIGPEGGFSENEVVAVESAGGRSVTLGRTTLRTETAGPAALAMIMYELEM